MKNLYYLILTLFTITTSNATDLQSLGTPTEDDRQSTTGFSENGSWGGTDYARSLLRPEAYILPNGATEMERNELLDALSAAVKAYNELYQYTDILNGRITNLLELSTCKLKLTQSPAQTGGLTSDNLAKLGDNIIEAVGRLKKAQTAKKLTADQNKALQSIVDRLTARVSELEQESSTYQPIIAAKLNESTANEAKIREMEENSRKSNERARELLETIGSLEEQLKRLDPGNLEHERASSKLLVDNLTTERDAEKARADREAAENNRLQSALSAAEARQRNAAVGGKEGSTLLVNDGGYTRVRESAGNGSRRAPKEEKRTCPCPVM